MNDASSDAMKTIALASSSERPRRSIGTVVAKSRLVLRRAGKAGQHAGVRRTGRDRIHADSRLGDLERHRLGDAFDGVLAADIDGGPRRALVPVGRGDVDDAAAALSLHDAHFVLHAQDHAENIGVERRGIAFRGLVGDRANLAFGAGVVHRDIEAAKPLDGLVDQSADVVLVADVGMDEFGLGAERTESFDQRLAGLALAAGDNDAMVRPSCERDGRCAADAREALP